jgi:serine/threonine-protein kinase ATR
MYLETHLRDSRQETSELSSAPKRKKKSQNGSTQADELGGLFGTWGFLGEGMTPEDIQTLQEIYSEIDEPDGMSGVASLTKENTARQQIADLESEGAWAEAMTLYESALQTEAGHVEHHMGLLNCLRHLGHLTTLITHVNGALRTYPEFTSVLAGYGVQAAWRLCRWDVLQEFLDMGPEPTFEVGLARIVLAMHNDDQRAYRGAMRDTRMAVMAPLSAASRESYTRAYPYFVRLHMLSEIQQAQEALVVSDSSSELLQTWADRLRRTRAAFRIREPVLSQRRVLLARFRPSKAVGDGWLALAREARGARQYETAASALLQARRLGEGDTHIEHAKLLRARGKLTDALRYLEKINASIPKGGSTTPGSAREDQARTCLLMGKWIQECGAKEGQAVIDLYLNAINILPKWEKAYFLLGKMYDKMGEAREGTGDKFTLQYTKPTLENYGKSLAKGHHYIFQSMPRLLTLWLDCAERWEQDVRSESRKSSESDYQSMHDFMVLQTATLSPYKWLTAMPQIVSRFCHPHPKVFKWLTSILVKVFEHYPQQALWLMAMKSADKERAKKTDIIISAAKQRATPTTLKLLTHASQMFEGLTSLCNYTVKKERVLLIQSLFPLLHRLCTSSKNPGLIMPLLSALTVTLPPSSSHASQSSAGDASMKSDDSLHHVAFPDDLVTIAGFENKVEILKSKEKPRKLVIIGSDGRTYPFLAKKEVRGDMRKNSRMMEFCTVINRLLKKDAESRKRNLRLRTFCVLPLTEDSGLIEWVPDTTGLRHVINDLLAKEGVDNNFNGVREQFEKVGRTTGKPTDAMNNQLKLFHSLLRQFPPQFRKYHLYHFPEPSTWFSNRLIYGRSLAAWSMVGHLVGLGDRHLENILIDEKNGELVHVDFDCLFDKGLQLEKPELVPFRLTPNLVDGLGISGVEGLFRRSAEVSMRVLRANEETLMSVLQTFVHDPLVEWRQSNQERESKATETLSKIRLRLKGKASRDSLPLNVHGQVHNLIEKAVSDKLLCQMYIGWMSWL